MLLKAVDIYVEDCTNDVVSHVLLTVQAKQSQPDPKEADIYITLLHLSYFFASAELCHNTW